MDICMNIREHMAALVNLIWVIFDRGDATAVLGTAFLGGGTHLLQYQPV